MFELTNEQRKCFGLAVVPEGWKKVKVKPSPYDSFETFAYLDGNKVRKVITVSEENRPMYCEYQMEAELSEDRKMLLPKTAKGKPKLFSTSNLLRVTPYGMAVQFCEQKIYVDNRTTDQAFYRSEYDGVTLDGIEAFGHWVEEWCAATGDKELAEIEIFAKGKRQHQKYREGDFFRFRINRSLYGYGRILIDFAQMRKDKIPFWDIFMGKPLCVAVYHIATDRNDVQPEQLENLPMLPSHMIMDNIFYYGECTVIGNKPISEAEQNYPVHYGRPINVGEDGVRYQCGKTFVALDNEKVLYKYFENNGIGWRLDVKLPILQSCIDAKSNQPYWDMYYPGTVNYDLRNPKFSAELKQIRKQMGIE